MRSFDVFILHTFDNLISKGYKSLFYILKSIQQELPMKTFILFTICSILTFGYLGCNSSSPDNSNDTSNQTPADTTLNDSSGTANSGDGNQDTNSSNLIDLTGLLLTQTSASCEDYVNTYNATAKDLKSNSNFEASVEITVVVDKCVITSNAIPNHDFNDGDRNFATEISTQNQVYQIPKVATAANQTTQLTLEYDDAVFLNGVKLDS
jgi:hypothetical protein